LGDRFDPVAEIATGGWTVVGGEARRTRVVVAIGACVLCGHARVTTPYSDAFLGALYTSDRFSQDTSFVPPDIITFCADALSGDALGRAVRAGGWQVDFGCGKGVLAGLLRDAGVPEHRLLGVDFHDRGVPVGGYRRLDLNRLSACDLPGIAGSVSFAYATQVLEHLPAPRTFLAAVHACLSPDGSFYLDVPDFSHGPRGGVDLPLVHPQHVQYFSLRHLVSLLEGCGFEVLRQAGGSRARCLVRKASGPAPRLDRDAPPGAGGPGPAVLETLARYRDQRRVAADRIVAVLAQTAGPIGLWGIGADFVDMMESAATIAAAVHEDRRLALFDLALAGAALAGRSIRHPDALATFSGPVLTLPALATTRSAMRAHAEAVALSAARLIDPWA